ncbi:MAG: putative monothiol glutaredoxin ycf64-like [Labilithrix sp.]|nr:putative monothiol glutaredoxin ycf64-like [Labilithrix sp.]
MLADNVKTQLDDLIKKNRVLLFMKGNKHFPQCGFSAQVVQILKETGTKFETVNVLQDPAIRDGIKEYSSWPTIPQLYVDGEFIGGCDIVKEMYASGDLHKKLGVQPAAPSAPPKVTLDDGAVKAIKGADEGNGDILRLEIGPQFQYDLYFGPKKPEDVEVVVSGVTICFDAQSAKKADGLKVSWVETADGGAFRIDNPNEPVRVKPLSATELKTWMDEGKKFELFDVRTDEERAIAKVDRARALDADGEHALLELDKSTPIVFMCHHGMRSRNAAERILREGFTQVFNLEGGIDAWSQKVDSAVPRY